MSTKQQETPPEPQEKVHEFPQSVSETVKGPDNNEGSATAETSPELPPEDRESIRIAALEAELAAVRE
jgi:hypothetical protein